MSMTPRERWLALLNRQRPDRIPTDYWATGEVTQRLLRELVCKDTEELFRKLHIDAPQHVGPQRTVTHYPGDDKADIWGMRTRRVEYGTGAYEELEHRPLASMNTVEEIHAHHWPSPDDFDWDGFRQAVKGITGHRVVRAGGYEPFLLFCAMRGMEQAFMDILIQPEVAEAALTHIFDYHCRVNERTFDVGHGKIDITYVAEDLGSQSGLLMGLEQIRRFILPNQRKMADLARSHGVHIFYHTDGSARDAIPDLLSVTGIEFLNPIQWRCPGMEREGLVRDFGDKVIFHGAIDNQQTLPFGAPSDVRQEVLDCIRIFSPARWICAPCHNLQPVTPTENIVTMYETMWENGKL